MDSPLKLDLILNGYNTDLTGLLAYILNKRLRITENQVRGIIGSVTLDEEKRRQTTTPLGKSVVDAALSAIPPEIGLSETPPSRQILIDILSQVTKKLEVKVAEDQIEKLSDYIVANWDSLKLLVEPLGEPERDEEEGITLTSRLEAVPQV